MVLAITRGCSDYEDAVLCAGEVFHAQQTHTPGALSDVAKFVVLLLIVFRKTEGE